MRANFRSPRPVGRGAWFTFPQGLPPTLCFPWFADLLSIPFIPWLHLAQALQNRGFQLEGGWVQGNACSQEGKMCQGTREPGCLVLKVSQGEQWRRESAEGMRLCHQVIFCPSAFCALVPFCPLSPAVFQKCSLRQGASIESCAPWFAEAF